MSQPLTIRLPDDLAAWLDQVAKETGRTKTSLVLGALVIVRAQKTWQPND